jgi:hypothetical protein
MARGAERFERVEAGMLATCRRGFSCVGILRLGLYAALPKRKQGAK